MAYSDDLKAEEAKQEQIKKQLEQLASTLTYFQLKVIIDAWSEKNGVLKVDEYLAASMPAERLEVYHNKFMDRMLTDDEAFRLCRNHYTNIRNHRQKLKKVFPNFPDTSTILLNFDSVDKIYKAGQRGLDNRWHTNKKKLP